MKKILWFIVNLIMMFSLVGCANNNTNSFPINPDSYNSATDTDGDSKEDSSDSSTEIEDGEFSESGENSGGNDDSSSNGNENKPSNEPGEWTGFY